MRRRTACTLRIAGFIHNGPNAELLGVAARTHGALVLELEANPVDFRFQFFNGLSSLHNLNIKCIESDLTRAKPGHGALSEMLAGSEQATKHMNGKCKTPIDALNWNTMNRCVADYLPSNGLHRSEQVAFSIIADEARNRPILDLGVGTGRTVRALMDISRNYVGVDYVPEMVATCRQRFPGVRFVDGDARNLSQFEDNSVFLVVFSQNGICMVDHEGRMAILKEVFRLLEPGGIFLFSSYNSNGPRHKAFFRFPDFNLTKNPFRLAVRVLRFAYHTVVRMTNRLRFMRLEQRGSEYSIITDGCHNYSILLYYTSLENHYRQLKSTGFKDILSFDAHGQRITTSASDNSIRFLARKPR